MLTYTFEKKGDTPYYEFLYDCMKEDILQGNIQANTKLPSKRSFAKQLGLSVMTIENAYEQLMVEGYIFAIEKRGYYVADVQELGYATDHVKEKDNKKASADYGKMLEGYVDSTDKEEVWDVDFATNQMSQQQFPMAIWAKLMRKVLSQNPEEILKNASSQGIYELREAIAKHLIRFRGMNVRPEQIVIGAGTEYLYQLLFQLLGREKVYGMENPGYQKLAKIYQYNGVPFQFVDIDKEGLSVENLRQTEASVIHTSPTHHFPTGAVMPIQRRQQLLQWSKEHEGRYILEDDYDCEFRFSGLPIPTLQSIDLDNKVIYLNTFSKSLSSSIRISYMVLPFPLLAKFQKELNFYACTVPNFEQYTLATFLEEGYFEKHINRMRNYYRNQRTKVIETVKESRLGECSVIREDDAGLHFLLHIDMEKKDEELVEMLKEKGIRLRCLSDYTNGKRKEFAHTFIINYTSIQVEKLPKVWDQIYECIF